MRYLMMVLFFVSLNVFSMDIDYEALKKNIEIDSGSVKDRLLLSRFYLNRGDNLKAIKLLDEVLDLEPDNTSALKMKSRAEAKNARDISFSEAGLSRSPSQEDAQESLATLFRNDNYSSFIDIYTSLLEIGTFLEDSFHIQAAYIFLWDEKYESSQLALERVTQENNLDVIKIKADICYFTGDYKCSADLFKVLYRAGPSSDLAVKLINSYIFTGRITEAEKIYRAAFRRDRGNKELSNLGRKITEAKNYHLINARKNYVENQSIETLKVYANALFASGAQSQTLDLIRDFNTQQPVEESLLLEAQYLVWMGKSNEALSILQGKDVAGDLRALFMLGQVQSWEHDFDEARLNLNKVIEKTADKDLLFEAKKALAFVSLWSDDKEEAQKTFIVLQRERPNDADINKALMELNYDYAELIKIHKKGEGSGGDKRLAELYIANNQPDKALKYLEKHVLDNPKDLNAIRNLALLLIERKDYYRGFGHLEYYAAQKRTSEANILLAKNYNWSGFSEEALDVLDSLLQREPNNEEAIDLKSSILKIAPRFTASTSEETLESHVDSVAKKQLFLADNLYFNSHYKASLKYFQNYFESFPYDHDARHRYVIALENSGEHGKAAGEISLLLWTKDSPELRYRYAYNTMRSGNLDKANVLFKELKKTSFRSVTPKISEFLKSWERDWESQDFVAYSSHYKKTFLNDLHWSLRKQRIFSQAGFIAVAIYDPVYKEISDREFIVKFHQEYASQRLHNKGNKELHIKCDKNRENCKIKQETWTKGAPINHSILLPHIERSLADIEFLREKPLEISNNVAAEEGLPVTEEDVNAPKETVFNGVVLAPGLEKNLRDENKSFQRIFLDKSSVKDFNKTQVREPEFTNSAGLEAVSFSDSTGISFNSVDLFYRTVKLSRHFDFGVDIGKFSIEQRNLAKYSGFKYGATMFYDNFFYGNFSFRLGVNEMDGFYEISPRFTYQKKYDNSSLSFKYQRQNALFYTKSLAPHEKRIVADHFSLTHFTTFDNNTTLWANLATNLFSNSDVSHTAQFDWEFYKPVSDSKFEYLLALSGWYTTHAKQHNDFYSPSFADATLLRVQPSYTFNKWFGIRGRFDVGYAFTDQMVPYKYGLSLYGTPVKNMTYNLNCLHTSSTKRAGNSRSYLTDTCSLNLGYVW